MLDHLMSFHEFWTHHKDKHYRHIPMVKYLPQWWSHSKKIFSSFLLPHITHKNDRRHLQFEGILFQNTWKSTSQGVPCSRRVSKKANHLFSVFSDRHLPHKILFWTSLLQSLITFHRPKFSINYLMIYKTSHLTTSTLMTCNCSDWTVRTSW